MAGNSLIIFYAITVLFNIAANLAHPVTPTIIKNLALADYMFGLAYGAMMFSNFLFSPFWGKRNEYQNSKSTMAICCFGYAIGQIMFAVSKTQGTILCARVFSGTFAGGIFVSFLTYLVNVSKDTERGKNLAVLAALQGIASAFGYFIGGIFGEISILLVFGIQAGMLIICGTLFLIVCKADVSKEVKKPELIVRLKTANPFAAFWQGRKFMNKRFVRLFLICGFAYLGATSFEQCFNYYIKDIFGLTSGYNGTIKATIGILSLIANATICVWIMKKTNVEKSTVVILAVCAASLFAVPFMGEPKLFIGLSVFFFAINTIVVPVTQDIVSKEATVSKEGNASVGTPVSSETAADNSSLVMGFYNGMKSLGGIFGALIAGALYTKNPNSPIFFGAVAFLAAFAVAWINILPKKPMR